MNRIDVSKDNEISDLTDIIVLLLRQGYNVSVKEDEFTFMVDFDYAEEEISETRLAWISNEEYSLLKDFREGKKIKMDQNKI